VRSPFKAGRMLHQCGLGAQVSAVDFPEVEVAGASDSLSHVASDRIRTTPWSTAAALPLWCTIAQAPQTESYIGSSPGRHRAITGISPRGRDLGVTPVDLSPGRPCDSRASPGSGGLAHPSAVGGESVNGGGAAASSRPLASFRNCRSLTLSSFRQPPSHRSSPAKPLRSRSGPRARVAPRATSI
jgi:hypothetical protein